LRIAYIANHDIRRNDGVTRKVVDQVNAWRKAGNTVRVFAEVPGTGSSLLECEMFPARRPAIVQRLVPNFDLLRSVRIFRPEIVYSRYNSWSFTDWLLSFRFRIVYELNSLDIEEMRLQMVNKGSLSSRVRYLGNRLLRSQLFRNAIGLVAVTEEIARHSSFSSYGKPICVVPNGIDLREYDAVKAVRERATEFKPRLFFIGTPNQPWHGVDLIESLALQLPDWEFHFVGLTKDGPTNCYYHGYSPTDQYLEVLRKCDVCLGTMALFRNKMTEASPLKVREYLAYGFPVVLGYKDTALSEYELPFVLRFDPGDSDVRSLVEFVQRNRNRVVEHSEIDMIDTSTTEARRLEFLEKVISDDGSNQKKRRRLRPKQK
jgi:hypothetical protein